jgi:hypothetical protein
MKKHNGMRPLDIVVLLKIIAFNRQDWLQKNIAEELKVSSSEISESLNRSSIAGLIDTTHRLVLRRSLIDFLQFGLKYVFPQQPGALIVGVPTAHSAPVLANFFIANDVYVWPDAAGNIRGQAIEPLYSTVPQACRQDSLLYELLALIDVLRVGRTREVSLAQNMLKERILQ